MYIKSVIIISIKLVINSKREMKKVLEKSFMSEEIESEKEDKQIDFKEKQKLLHLEEIATLVNLLVNQDNEINLENISFNGKLYSIKMNSQLSDDSKKNYNHDGEIVVSCSDGRSLSISEEIKAKVEKEYSDSGWFSWEKLLYHAGIVCSYEYDNLSISLYFNNWDEKLKKVKKFINNIGIDDCGNLVYDCDGRILNISPNFNVLTEYGKGWKYIYRFDFNQENICKLSFRNKRSIGDRQAELLIDENEVVLIEENDRYNNEIIEDNISLLEKDKKLIEHTMEESKTDYPIKKLQEIIHDLDVKINGERTLKKVYDIALDIFSKTNDMLNIRNLFVEQKIADYIFSETELLLIINLLKDIVEKLNEEKERKINEVMEGLSEEELKVLRKKIGK